MSAASALPYQLRPNKAVDRELFLSLLSRLSGTLRLENYTYIGLGGPFLEDFRLVHSRLGVQQMVCIEAEKAVHERQCFNRPVPSVECVHNTLEDYIDSANIENSVILWFDYTDPKSVTKQISRFAETVASVPIHSILRITLNANPESLGKPEPLDIQTPPNGLKNETDPRPTLYEWRLARLRNRLGVLFPTQTQAADMARSVFGRVLLQALKLAVSNELLSTPDRTISWMLATHYADGQAMVTATLLVLPVGIEVDTITKTWNFYSTPDNPLLLDMPVISTRERLTLESNWGRSPEMSYEFPHSALAEDPIEAFKRYYRVFPHYSRVDL